ncbi:MAG: hypothetical protein WC389_21730 [Lutibacter sp.]|jgi:phosphoribosylanthranilate isomerase
MKQILRQVTVTGADDSVDPICLLGIAKAFPFVEFGILCSKNNAGTPRFPSYQWLDKLYELKQYGVPLSMHLCGTWVRWIFNADKRILEDKLQLYFRMFDRIQLNFHAQPHFAKDGYLYYLKMFGDKPIIFQMDGTNENLYHGVKNFHVMAYPLYDLSGGNGVLPDKWDKPIGNYCGYAGGLSPENLQENLGKLSDIVGDIPIWIDAETSLRSNDNMQFDIDKVVRFLIVAKPYVISNLK